MHGEGILRMSPLYFVFMRYLCVSAHCKGRGATLLSNTGHVTFQPFAWRGAGSATEGCGRVDGGDWSKCGVERRQARLAVDQCSSSFVIAE